MPPFSHDNGVEQTRKTLNLSFMFFSHLSQQPNHAPLKQNPIIFWTKLFWPNNTKKFFHFAQPDFIIQQQNLVHNEIVLSSIMPKLTLQFNKEFGTHCFFIITNTSFTHGSCCNRFISHGNNSPNNLVNSVFNIFSTILQLR